MRGDSVPAKQYYLTTEVPNSVPDGFRRQTVGGWHIVCDASYDVIPVTANDQRVGYVVGTVLDVRGEHGSGQIDLGSVESTETVVAAFESVQSDFVGGYVALVCTDDSYLYTDPGGVCPVVYASDRRLAGASPAALPGVDTDARFRRDLFEAVTDDGDQLWLPGKKTYYSGVQRLLPNHRLDLQTWESSRYWPTGELQVNRTADPIEAIATNLRAVFETVVANYASPILALSAGKDSRALLAVARDWLVNGEVACFTWDSGEQFDMDRTVARRIATDRNIAWRPVPVIEASESEREQWLQSTGHAVGGQIMGIYPSLQSLDGDVHLVGTGGEIGRGYYWSDEDDPDATFSATELLERLHRPRHAELVDAVEEWLDGTSCFDAYTLLDLAYQELRLGCWAGPQSRVSAKYVDEMMPFEYRPVVEAMHRVPPAIRMNDNLMPRIVERTWPELNTYPYNEYDDWRIVVQRGKEIEQKLRTALDDPERAYDYLQRLLADQR